MRRARGRPAHRCRSSSERAAARASRPQRSRRRRSVVSASAGSDRVATSSAVRRTEVTRTPATRTVSSRSTRACRGTVLAGSAAAWVLCGSPAPRVLDVVYPPGRHRPAPLAGRAPRQSHVLRDDRTLVAGVLVTSVVRTALDVATRCEPDEALRILRRLRDVCGLEPRLAARSLELRHRWSGRPRARRTLALLLAGEDDPV